VPKKIDVLGSVFMAAKYGPKVKKAPERLFISFYDNAPCLIEV
jgi:hypothetical protein